LTPASGRQDHTTSPSADAPVVGSAFSVHRISPRVRDDRASAPPWDGTERVLEVIWVRREAEYFLKQDWTTQIALKVLAFLPTSRTPQISGVPLLQGSCQ